jgi:Recombination endonuclease VII
MTDMPPFEWNNKLNAFAKECSRCKAIFAGAEDQPTSEKIFRKYFFEDYAKRIYGRGSRVDGFYPICKRCCNSNTKTSKGVKGLEPRILEILHERQDGKCAICRCEIDISQHGAGGGRWGIDHDPVSMWIRELLCGKCNVAMAYVDDVEWLKKAISYRKKHLR